MDFIGTLPIEVAQVILTYLRADELARCAMVCRRWREIVIEYNRFWMMICRFEGIDRKDPSLKSQYSENDQDSSSLPEMCPWAANYSLVRKKVLHHWLDNNPQQTTACMFPHSLLFSNGRLLVCCTVTDNYVLLLHDIRKSLRCIQTIMLEALVDKVLINGPYIAVVQSLKVVSVFRRIQTQYFLLYRFWVENKTIKLRDGDMEVPELISVKKCDLISQMGEFSSDEVCISSNNRFFIWSLSYCRTLYFFDLEEEVVWSLITNHGIFLKTSSDLFGCTRPGHKIRYEDPEPENDLTRSSRVCNSKILVEMSSDPKSNRSRITVWKTMDGKISYQYTESAQTGEMLFLNPRTNVLVYTIKFHQPKFAYLDLREEKPEPIYFTPFEYGYIVDLCFIRADLMGIIHSSWGSCNVTLFNVKTNQKLHSTMIDECSIVHCSRNIILVERIRSRTGLISYNYNW